MTLSQGYAGSRQITYETAKMCIFSIWVQTWPHTVSICDLNLAAVRLTPVQTF